MLFDSSEEENSFIEEDTHPEDELLKVTSLRCQFHVGCKLDLRLLSYWLPNSVHEAGKSFLLHRLSNPHVTANIQHSGSIMLTGVKTLQDALRAARVIAYRIQKHLRNIRISNDKFDIHPDEVGVQQFQIVSYSISAQVPYRINLAKLSDEDNVSYDAEQSQGASYTIAIGNRDVKSSIYSTGKVRLNSVKRLKDGKKAWRILYNEVLPKYKN